VNAAKPVRAATLPRVFWSLPDLRRWALRSGVFALCLAATLMLTALRLEITRLRYELSALHRRRVVASADVARLRVETAALAAPARIEEKARALGLVYPDRGHMVVLDE
jgi:cell division protein FtsL